MKVIPTELPEVLLLEPTVHPDDRGYLFEAWNRAACEAAGIKADFVQDNQSRSRRNVVRGLHYQVPPHPQAKLLRVVAGEIFDVAVDIRRSSPRFGKWTGAVLSAENKRMLWIPEGFAHGFLALAEGSEVIYKIAGRWSRECERSIRWDDPAIGIDWPRAGEAIVSERDRAALPLSKAEVFA
ncbi:MAG: dTDP-4-dehydrorhamnose 3,5-epimerase [Burkholderiales bacterium]|nr:dTDP-4-dehydrorhamnose 3,5-epimerase [Burkholderiales bacterium]